jgi:hypothetical protein
MLLVSNGYVYCLKCTATSMWKVKSMGAKGSVKMNVYLFQEIVYVNIFYGRANDSNRGQIPPPANFSAARNSICQRL